MWYNHFNKIEDKNMIFLKISECIKSTWKIQHLFKIKTLHKLGTEETYLNKIKVIYNKPTGNIMLNSKRLKAFPLRSKTRQGCPLLFNIVMEVLTKAIRQKKEERKEKRNKRHPHQKESELCLQVIWFYI